MPKKIYLHSIVNSNGDIYVIGGMYFVDDHWKYEGAIHKLSCINGNCQWKTIKQELKLPRIEFVAIPVPDSFCKPSESCRFQANLIHVLILIACSLL